MEKAATSKRWIDRVVETLEPEAVGARPDVLEEFARQLLARASADFLERREAELTAQEIAGLFRFVESTAPDEIGVRVREVSDGGSGTVVETAMPDCSFIVNTLREFAHAEDFNVVHLLHPVVVLQREDGETAGVADRSAEGERTSIVYMVLDRAVDEERRGKLESEIRRRLGLVRLATSDFEPMVERAREVIADLEEEKERVPWRTAELEEIREFLSWLVEGAFVFLGYRSYRLWADEEGRRWIQVEQDSGLGILREERESRYAEPQPLDELPEDLRARVLGGPLLIVSKTNAESPVHRRARMDYLGVKRLGAEGEVIGERRFLGLFTAKAYAQDASSIPILRRKLQEILEAEGVSKGSHDYNQILQIFNSMPKEELFLSSVPELLKVIGAVMETEGADEVRVVPRTDPLARGVNVLVMLPRDRFSEEVRHKVQEVLLEVYAGELLNYHLSMDGGDQARLHFYLSSDRREVGDVDVQALEERVRESVRSWDERLHDALHREHDAERAGELSERHGTEFSTEYKATIDVATAVEDIDRLEALSSSGLQQLTLEASDAERPKGSRVKIFAIRGTYVLSDLMPVLENLGLRVIEADKYDVGAPRGEARTIHTFEVEAPAEWGLAREAAQPRMESLFRAIHDGVAEDDRLNSLILSAGLEWREVALLRAYAGYAFRIGAVTSRAGVREPLAEHPEATRLLFRVFESVRDPEVEEDRRGRTRRLVARFHDALDEVGSIEYDRSFRRLLNLVQATTRTNFFQKRARERESGVIALKFDCSRIEVMPRPRPRYEIYVNGGHTEGAHLRMDTVARGGIRWSDRSEDFRVEVLGLAKTQQVKNAVIVPAGAKGAFVVKDPPEDPEELQATGEACYREFIRGLLDLTDNIRDGAVVHPPETVVGDGADPYLVVAADKGTAHLSDTANALAEEYDFWLGDAFASGGSQGYDHKDLGITARGAWECVRRHFRERGVDIQEETFTVAGVGDMSGDVFGNGMLLSDRIRLVAAFDHRHVFLDPDPDPEASFAERKRLFEMERSSWDDYDRDVISEGGGVWGRGAKEIELSPPARELLGLEDGVVNGEALVRAVLTADVDLLWNGGIGTYVKASDETHGEVADPGNDAVRVDANELRASVIAEGGNLGLTQRARVEYALGGGRLNTDALDNSGGVDMSDHEVNLKVLLRTALERGDMSREERNELLREITGEVVQSVLDDNYGQSLAVSLDEYRARQAPAEFRDTLVRLERDGSLERSLEGLPTTEALLERQEEGAYLTRPELAVMLAYAKTHLKERLRRSGVVEEPALLELFRGYFPDRVLERTDEADVRAHPLRDRIIATVLTNRFVDRMGVASHVELMRETGEDAAEVASAWHAACRIARVDELYDRLRDADHEVPAGVQLQWYLKISDVLERATRWLLTAVPGGRSIDEVIERYERPVQRLRDALPQLLAGGRVEELERVRALHETDGLAGETALELATLEYVDGLLPVAELARHHGLEADLVGEVYFGLAEVIDFPWLHDALGRTSGSDLWKQRAARGLSLELESARSRMASHVVRDVRAAADVERALEEFRRAHREDLDRIRQVIGDVQGAEHPNLAALTVAVHAIRNQPLVRDGG